MSTSIVIVTYNSSKLIEKLLQTIENQEGLHDALEIILVDNRSPDVQQLRKIISMFKNTRKFRLIVKYREHNHGFGNSCNYGAALSSKEYLLFLNPDTKLNTNSISTLYNHAKTLKADIIGGKTIHYNTHNFHRTVFNKPTFKTMLLEFSNIGKLLKLKDISGFYLDQDHIKDDTVVDGVGGAYLMIKKSVFDRLKGFDSRFFMYLEDVDLCVRAKQSNLKIIYCPHSKIYHIGGASSKNKYRIHHKAWYDSREYYMRKHFPLVVSLIVIPFYKLERFLLDIRVRYLK